MIIRFIIIEEYVASNNKMALMQQVIDTDTNAIHSQRILGQNKDFVQLQESHMTLFRALNLKNHKAMNFLMFLLEHMNRNNALIVSRDTLAEIFEVSKPTIDRWVRFCKDHMLIQVGRTGSSSIYYVNSTIAWKSKNSKRQFAQFTAEVMISKSEQERELEQSFHKQINLSDEYRGNIALAKHLKKTNKMNRCIFVWRCSSTAMHKIRVKLQACEFKGSAFAQCNKLRVARIV